MTYATLLSEHRFDVPIIVNIIRGKNLITGPPFVESLLRQAKTAGEPEALARGIKRSVAGVKKLEARLSRLIEMRADGEITKAQYIEQATSTRTQIRQTKTAINCDQKKLSSLDGSELTRAVQAVHKVLRGSKRLDLQQKSRILRSLVHRVDTVVHLNPKGQPRNRAGQYTSTKRPKWAVRDMEFDLEDREPALGTSRY